MVTNNTIVFGMSYLVVSMLVVACNSIVVFVIVKTRALHVSTLTLIAHMAFWDLVQGLVYMIFVVPSAFLNRFVFSQSLMSWTACILSFLTGITIMNTVTIVLDRFVSLKWPFKHRQLSSKRMYSFLGVCLYILAFMRLLPIFFPDAKFIYSSKTALCLNTSTFKSARGVVASTGIVVISFAIIVVCSGYILRLIHLKRRRIHTEQSVPIPSSMIKQSLMCVLSAAVLCLSFVPYVFEMISTVSNGGEPSDVIARFAAIALLSNSIWNVVIYSLNYGPFRDSFLKLFCRSHYRKIKRRKQIKIISNGRTPVHRIDIPKRRMFPEDLPSVEE